MQVTLYHGNSTIVKILFHVESHDYYSARRNTNAFAKSQSWCPKCYGIYYKLRINICPRCMPDKVTLNTSKMTYGKYRSHYKTIVKKLWNKPLIGTPVKLEIIYGRSKTGSMTPDIDNITSFVSGMISQSVIYDDRLIWDISIKKDVSPALDNTIVVYIDRHDNNYRSSLVELSKIIPGKIIRVPKNKLSSYWKTEEEVTTEIYSRFHIISPVGEHYENVISWFRDKNPDMDWLSNTQVRNYYRTWRLNSKNGE